MKKGYLLKWFQYIIIFLIVVIISYIMFNLFNLNLNKIV